MILSLDEFTSSLGTNLKDKPKTALVADNDIDGVTATAKMDQALYNLAEIEVEPFFRQETDWELPIPEIQSYKPKLLILLDIATGSSSFLRTITKKPRYSYSIDHHITSETELPPHLKMYNPGFDGEIYLPTVYLVDQVISKVFNIIPHEFFPELTFLGVFADAGIGFENGELVIEHGLENMISWANQEGSSLLKVIKINKIELPRAHHLTISFNYYIKDKGIQEANIQLVNSMDQNKDLTEFLHKIETDYQYETEDLYAVTQSIISQDKSDANPVLVYHNETGEHSNSDLARLVVERVQKPTLVYSNLISKKGPQILASGRAPRRANKEFDLIPVFSKYGGGGHKKACGLRIAKSDFDLFVEDFLKLNS